MISDSTLIDVFDNMVAEHRCSVDAILVPPELREDFLSRSRSFLGDGGVRLLLQRLINLRKQRKLPKSR